MKSIWLLIKKNLRLLVRSKTSALVIFFAPLLIMLLLGLSYDTSSSYGLNIGVYAPAFSEDVESLITSLQEQEFKIIKYETTVDDCVEDIKAGYVHTCLSIPESLQVEDNQQKEVTFYVDPSKINLVWMIQENLGSKFNLKSQEISQGLTSGILTSVADAKTQLSEESTELNGVKEKSSAASASALSVSQQLGALDLNLPASTYNPQALTTIKSSLSLEVENSLVEVDDAREAVEAANITNDAQILNSLNDIETKLEKVDALLSGAVVSATNSTNTSSNSTASESLSSILTLLEQDLTATQNKLTAASQAVISSSSSLSSASQAMQESVGALDNVQQGLGQIKTTLESQKVTDANVISSPLITRIEPVAPENTYLNYLFPALLVLVVMFSSLLLGTTLVMMEKNSPAFFRNYFLPLRKGTFVISTFFTTLLITLVQVVIILGVSMVFLKESIFYMLPVAGVLLLSSSVFSFMGMGIGYAFKSEETGTLASISTGSLLLFVSGVVLPIESISPLVRKITALNPFVISESIIREVFLFNADISAVWVEVASLIGYAVGLFAIILVVEYLVHKHFISGFMKHRHLKHRQQEKRDKNNV